VRDILDRLQSLVSAGLVCSAGSMPTHDQLQAIVSGLAGLGVSAGDARRFTMAGASPFLVEGICREGFIVNPFRDSQKGPNSQSNNHRGLHEKYKERTVRNVGSRTTPTERAARGKNGLTTQIGYINRNHQEVVRKTPLPGNDHNQFLYVMQCQDCRHEYGSNGSDIWQRKCPSCQRGAEVDHQGSSSQAMSAIEDGRWLTWATTRHSLPRPSIVLRGSGAVGKLSFVIRRKDS
jgi:hypothetical protein